MSKIDIDKINTGDVEVYSYLGEAYLRLPDGIDIVHIFKGEVPIYKLDITEVI